MAAADKRSEKEKMLAGELYYSFDQQLFEERQRAKELLHKYNQSWQVRHTYNPETAACSPAMLHVQLRLVHTQYREHSVSALHTAQPQNPKCMPKRTDTQVHVYAGITFLLVSCESTSQHLSRTLSCTHFTCCLPCRKTEGRAELLQQLLGSMDAADPPFIEPPFMCDYGSNIHIGSGSYMNFGCTILDACK